jgi:hypothetical protein
MRARKNEVLVAGTWAPVCGPTELIQLIDAQRQFADSRTYVVTALGNYVVVLNGPISLDEAYAIAERAVIHYHRDSDFKTFIFEGFSVKRM